MSNKWTSTKKFDEKIKITKRIVEFFPDCESMIIMPSTTCFDLKEMKNQNKITDKTITFAFDNLKGVEFQGKNYRPSDKRMLYKKKYREACKQIFGNDDFYRLNEDNLFLGDNIQDKPLQCLIDDKCSDGCDLIYADTCGEYKERIQHWISTPQFLSALKSNGVFALTILLKRYKLIGNTNQPDSDPIITITGKGMSKMDYLKKLYIIANDVEARTKNVLQAKALIGYSDTQQSPMGVAIFQKK